MKFYFSHKWNEYMVSRKNWKKDDKSDWWNDTINVHISGSTCSDPDYRYRHELPWHFRRLKLDEVPAQVKKIAEYHFCEEVMP